MAAKPQILAGLNILIVTRGLKGATARFTALTKVAADRGATLLTTVPKDEAVKLLVLTDLDYVPTLAYLDVPLASKSAARLQLVRPDWLSECATKRERVPYAIFSVAAPPTSSSSPSTSLAASAVRGPDASWSDSQFRTILHRPSSTGMPAVDADPERSRQRADEFFADNARPLDRFQHSPRRLHDTVDDDEFVVSQSRHLQVPLKPAMARVSPGNSSPHSHVSASSPRGNARRVHFGPPSAATSSTAGKRALEHDDPLLQMLSRADEIQPQYGSPTSDEDDDGESTAASSRGGLRREPLNDLIVRELQVIEQHSRLNGDVHRANAYRNGIDTLRAMINPIFSLEDLRGAAHFKPGGSLWMKVGEIIATGSLRRAKMLRASPEFNLKAQLAKVFGAGPVEVQAWIGAGVTSVEQLRDRDWCERRGIFLPRVIEIGVQYFDALQQKLTRAQVTTIYALIERVVLAVVPNAIMMLCGSFRRGEESCSDVDVLVTRSDGGDSMAGMLDVIVNRLQASGIVLARLSIPRLDSERFLGICKPPDGAVCRVDLNVCHPDEFAPAQLHATGSAEFNRALARRARSIGLTLGPRALRTVSGPKHDEARGAPMALKSEADIFAALGVRFYEPRERSWLGLRELDLVSASANGPGGTSARDFRYRAIFSDAECAPEL